MPFVAALRLRGMVAQPVLNIGQSAGPAIIFDIIAKLFASSGRF